jgi:hypothetical protein
MVAEGLQFRSDGNHHDHGWLACPFTAKQEGGGKGRSIGSTLSVMVNR